MKSRILTLLLISSLLVFVESGRRRRRRWTFDAGANWSPNGGWSVGAKLSFRFKKKRSTSEDALIDRCLPTLPCKFEIYDTDENGVISLDEFENKLTDMRFTDNRHSIFIALDADGDDNINKEEFSTGTVEIANAILFPECNQGN